MITISTDAQAIAPWMAERLQRPVAEGQLIAAVSDGVVLSAAWFEVIFGSTVVAHLATGTAFLPREFLWYIFHYPFRELQAERILAPVASSNHPAQRIVTHLGFVLEATLSPQESPVWLYTMTEAQCRWLSLKEPQNGKCRKHSHRNALRDTERAENSRLRRSGTGDGG